MNLQAFFYRALENKPKNWAESLVGNFFSFLIILNIIALILSTVESFHVYSGLFFWFEIFSLSIFSVEYFLRLWVSPLKKNFISYQNEVLHLFMIFDLLVILPGVLSLFFPGVMDMRTLRIIRVFRIFRLKQYSDSLSHIFSIIHEHRKDLISAFSLIFMGVVIASTFMYYAERDLQPEKLSSIPDALYWGFITLSTIGYGDITPISGIGKVITIITALMGVAIYALPTSILGAAFYAELRSKEAQKILLLKKQLEKLRKKNEHLTLLLEKNPSSKEKSSKKSWWKKIF